MNAVINAKVGIFSLYYHHFLFHYFLSFPTSIFKFIILNVLVIVQYSVVPISPDQCTENKIDTSGLQTDSVTYGTYFLTKLHKGKICTVGDLEIYDPLEIIQIHIQTHLDMVTNPIKHCMLHPGEMYHLNDCVSALSPGLFTQLHHSYTWIQERQYSMSV